MDLAIFDLDNTIYDWYAGFVPPFYAMVDEAVKALGCDRDELIEQLRAVHVKHHDVEHPFALFETAQVQALVAIHGPEEVWKRLDPAFHAFNASRKQRLQLFSGVRETLTELRDRRIKLAAFTDSKYFAAIGRIVRFDLGDVFDRVYCRARGSSVMPQLAENRFQNLEHKIVELPAHESKPDPKVLQHIAEREHCNITSAAYVGDSLAKDVLMAKEAGCFSVWAKYGAAADKCMYEKLVRISHWTQADIQRERMYAEKAIGIEPDLICERSISEILPVFARR